MSKIKKVAVLGSGIMGMGIAGHIASAGVKVVLLDIVPPDLKGDDLKNPALRNKFAATAVQKALKAKQSPLMSKEDAELITIGNFDDDMKLLMDCDLIIEVVVENLKIKQALFKKIKPHYNGTAIISSNTSGIPIKAIAEIMPDTMKANFLGTHFFNPVRFMHLLEIIPTADTSVDVIATISEFCTSVLGKGVVNANDTPNFVGNRIGVAGMIFSMKLMLEMGLSIHETDQIMGPPMGRPKSAMYRTADLVGIDTLIHVAKNTRGLVNKTEADQYFTLPGFIEEMGEKGLLGNKTGGGFYKREGSKFSIINPDTLKYDPKPKEKIKALGMIAFKPTPGERIAATIAMKNQFGDFAWKVFADGCLYAASLIPEIADTIVEIDNAMKWGYNFDMGPFEAWDAVGVEAVIERMKADGMSIPKVIEDMLSSGSISFYREADGKKYFYDFAKGDYVEITPNPDLLIINDVKKKTSNVIESCNTASLLDIGDGVLLVQFHSPMNSLDRDMWEIMRNAVELAEAKGVGVVIGNQDSAMPGAFSAGANISMILEGAKAADWKKLEDEIKFFQETNLLMTYSPVPVVAAPYGLTLGGGAEVAMSCNKIVCHHDLFMGLVEAGVGVVPAGGGCMLLMRHYQNFVPKNAVMNNLQPFAQPVIQMIGMATVSTSAANARELGFVRPWDKIHFHKPTLVGQAKKEVLAMAAAGFTPPRPQNIQVMGDQLRGLANALVHDMKLGGHASEHDALILKKLAHILGGGFVPENSWVSEEDILALEREVFLELCAEQKTQDRLQHMLLSGKPLRN